MAIRVQVKDGPIVEFPDGTSEETMQRALAQFRTETTWGEFAQGAALDLASGIMGFGKAIPDALSFVLPDAWTDPWSEFFERGQESARALQNDAYKKEKSIKPITVNPETGKYQFQMPSAESVVGMGLESLPLAAFFGAAGPISAAARGATMLTKAGSRVAPLAKAGRELDALVFGLINSGVVAPGQWRDTYHEAIEKKGMTPEQAREAANQAALAVAGISLGTGAAGGLVASKLGGGSGNLLTAAGKGFVGEAPFEGVEEGFQNLAGDLALGEDPDFLEAANATITAAAGGGAPGAVGAVAEYAGESGYQRSGAAREDLDLRREYFDALEEARRTAEEIEGGQEPPTAANPPSPPPAPVAPKQETYDAALEELEKAATAEEKTVPENSNVYFGFGTAEETAEDFDGLSDEELEGELRTLRAAWNDPANRTEFLKMRLGALEAQAAKRWGEAGQARQEAATKVEIPQGQTALNQPQQSVGEWKPTPELEPIEKMGAAERALESAEDPNVPLPPDPEIPAAPKGPPDLLTELAGLRIRIDRDAFRGDLMNDVNPQIGNRWLFEGKRSGFKGMGPEELVTFLVENNYINPPDPNAPTQYGINEAVDLLNSALRGERVISQNYEIEEARYQEDLRYIEEVGRQAFEEENAAWEENEAIWALRLAEAELESEQDIDAWVDKTFEEQSNATEQKTAEGVSESGAESQGSLIPEATPAEQVRAEQERRDAERNGLNRDLVEPEQGEGELLAGPKPEQTDIEEEIERGTEKKDRVVSDEAYEKAKAELKSAATRVNSGIDPAIIKNLAIMAAYHIENLGHDFKQWSSEVQKRFGNRFDDMLEAAWGQATQTREGLPTQKEAPPAPVEAKPTPAEPAPVSRAPEDFDPNSETGTAHVITNQERRLRGKSEILAQAREANADVLDRAQTAMDENPNLAPSLVSELLNDPDPSISKFKEAVLLIYKVDLQNRIKDIGKRAAATGNPQQAAQYHEQYRQVQLEMDMLDRATYESGSIWGDFGQFRGRLWANDYSFESRKALAEAKLGRPLSDSESKKLKAMAAKVEELQARLEGRNEAHADKVDKYWSEGHYQRLRAMYDRQGRPKAKPAGAVSLQQRKKAALQRFKAQSRKC